MDDIKNILDLIESFEWIECFGGRAPVRNVYSTHSGITGYNSNIRGLFSFKDEDTNFEECYDYRESDSTCLCNGFTGMDFTDPIANQHAAERYVTRGIWW